MRKAVSQPPENTVRWDSSRSETQFKSCLFQAAFPDHSPSRWSGGLVRALRCPLHLDLNSRHIFAQPWPLRRHFIPRSPLASSEKGEWP